MTPLVALALALAQAPGEALTPAQAERRTPIVDVVRAEGGAVVGIAATHVVTHSVSAFDVFEPAPRGADAQAARQSIGAGSVIHPSGYVLTNAHVVAMASELSVILEGGRELTAHVVAALPEEDLAVVKAELPRGTTLQAARLGASDDVMVGEAVVAIGAQAVTAGIVSARDREVQVSGRVRLQDLLVIDGALDAGDAGGPLFNALGAQIGVRTALRGGASRAGLAIAIDRVKAALPRLLANHARGRAGLGLVLGRERAHGAARGVAVASVARGSPAEAAGLEPGMIVVEVAGHATPTLVDALVALLEQPAAEPCVVRAVLPEGTTDVFRVAVDAPPPPDGAALARARLGLELKDLDAASAARLGLRAGAGVVVQRAAAGTAAARAGVQPGDLLTRVGAFGIRKLADLGGVLDEVSPGDGVAVRLVRIGRGRVQQTEIVLDAR